MQTHASPVGVNVMNCLERLLMSRMFRRYVECLTVVFFPWVLLTEQESEDLETTDPLVNLCRHGIDCDCLLTGEPGDVL